MDTKLPNSTFATKLVRRAVHELRYPCCFNDFVKDLQGQEEELIKKWNDVDGCVKSSKTQVLNVPVVREWLQCQANPLKSNVEELLKEAMTRSNKRCCFIRCPNWTWRYRMAKKLEKKKVKVQKCIKDGDLYVQLYDNVVSPSDDTQHLLSGKSLEFDSRKDAYKKLMEALKDGKVGMIGIYGMGGCGKTTMAMELKRTAEAEHVFHEVHFVTVSNNIKVEVRIIQDKIAKALQIFFKKDEESERAKYVRTRLSLEHKRILLILDDVWQNLDFAAIGVPFGENRKNCKVLITTRSQEVCNSMLCQRKIYLPILTDEEAWTLFQKQAQISISASDSLKRLGRQISDECKGLPVAIAALAGTLKGKAEGHWKEALDRLRNSIRVNIEESLQNPYSCLRISYDNLDSEEAKSIFLLCSVFPEDFEIPVEFLTMIAIGLGLVGEFQSYEVARNKVIEAKNKLISSSLLSLSDDPDDEEWVKMHDLVRDVSLWIAGEENKVIKCLLEEDVPMECTISIRYLFCEKFQNELNYSSIEFLSIYTNLEVSDEMFIGMESLRVLYLGWKGGRDGPLLTISFKSLTISFKSLINLRCLCLDWWELGDISFVGHMTKLESLTLRYCSFVALPDVVVTRMTNLRLLGLLRCRIRENPFNVIGSHPRLEELNFCVNYDMKSDWYFDCVDRVEFFKKFRVPPTLQRYCMILGQVFQCHASLLNGNRTLVLSWLDASNAEIMDLAKKAEVLRVTNIMGSGKNFIPGIFQIEGGRNMNYYKWVELVLCNSEEIEYVVDTRNHPCEAGTLFSKLRKLTIEDMKHLRALYRAVPPSDLFVKLEQLHIKECPMLTRVFTLAVARSLVQLKILEIWTCPKLEHIIADDDTEDGEISSQDDRLVFSNLKQLDIRECEMLEYIIPVTFAQGLLQLESIYICLCSELKYVFGQRTRGDQIQNIDLKIDLPSLQKLQLTKNSNIMSIFPSYCSATWSLLHVFNLKECPDFDIMHDNAFKASSLKVGKISRLRDESVIEKHFLTSKALEIHENSKIESIFCLDNPEEIGQPISLRIESMEFFALDKMKYICVGGKNSFTFQNLKNLSIIGCYKLEVIFPASVLRCLPELYCLNIRECEELKKIIEDEDVEDKKNSNLASSSQPCFPKLAALFIENCHNLKRLFRVSASNEFSNLECLVISGASKLEELISCEQAGQGGDDIGKAKLVNKLDKLDVLVLLHLPNLCQEIELPTLTTRVVHDCPKLSLTSSITTIEEFDVKLRTSFKEEFFFSHREIRNIVCEVIESRQDLIPGDTIAENADGSKIQNPLAESGTTIEIPQSIEGTESATIGEVLASVKPTLPSTSGSELATPSNLVDQESTIEPSFLDKRHELGESVSIEDKIKESVLEGSTSEDTTEETIPVGTEGNNGLGVMAATNSETGTLQCPKMQNIGDSIQEESNLIDKEGEINFVSNGSIEVDQGACADTSSRYSSIVAELGAFKHSADLNDAQIVLLAEAIAVHPHLLKILDKFSTRFQAWILKTLVDMLLFLRNESAASVTPQRENEFLKLCDEAVQLGLDKSWVDEMRERVMVRDSAVEQAKARLDQLTQELGKIKDEIDNLHLFVDSQKKCFDFL